MSHYWRVSLLALPLASAGMPIYIHVPNFAVIGLVIGVVIGAGAPTVLALIWPARAGYSAFGWMVGLAIAGFVGAAALPQGAALGFGVICVVSGFALGADMVILSALFASSLARAGLQAGQAFGIWSFASKSALKILAIATVITMPRPVFAAPS
ncbi:hypothetical protein [uncultured Thioclava sp.]|uniref:hypothetical protein n=1 Tax=uncultured Thioclava sp. TaxID=473858 RepID=UPI0034599AEC